MNFGTILNSVTKNCVTMMVESKDRESKSLAKDFIDYVHLKEVLDIQFSVYQKLNSSFIKDSDSAKLFVSECLSTLDGYKFKDILHLNRLVESKFKVGREKSSDINFHIANLIKYKTSEKKTNQEEYINGLNALTEHLTSVREEKNLVSELKDGVKNSELKT